MTKRIAIVGGGLAGLTAALKLSEMGHKVQLFEGQPFLGGRASTFRDDSGDVIEQGLHIFLGAYTEFRALLKELHDDGDEPLDWMTELRLHDPAAADGPVTARYGIDPLRAPLKTLGHLFAHNEYLDGADKASLVPLMSAAAGGYEALKKKHDGQSVTEWWAERSGRPEVLERFLRPFCRAVQFTEPEQFSAFTLLGLVHQVLLEPSNLRVAGYRGARGETIFQPLARKLAERGCDLRCSSQLQRIEGDESGVRSFTFENAEVFEADVFVSALPVWALRPALSAELRRIPFFARLDELPVAPAISVQLWFDRPVVGTRDYTMVANSRAVVFAEQSQNAYPTAGGGRISVCVCPADDLLEKGDDELVEMALAPLRVCEPTIAAAAVTKAVVLKHRHHLLRPAPGVMSSRPSQETPVPNFFLAGDWTEQPFFGTQEGAVRSGLLCAKAVAVALKGAGES